MKKILTIILLLLSGYSFSSFEGSWSGVDNYSGVSSSLKFNIYLLEEGGNLCGFYEGFKYKDQTHTEIEEYDQGIDDRYRPGIVGVLDSSERVAFYLARGDFKHPEPISGYLSIENEQLVWEISNPDQLDFGTVPAQIRLDRIVSKESHLRELTSCTRLSQRYTKPDPFKNLIVDNKFEANEVNSSFCRNSLADLHSETFSEITDRKYRQKFEDCIGKTSEFNLGHTSLQYIDRANFFRADIDNNGLIEDLIYIEATKGRRDHTAFFNVDLDSCVIDVIAQHSRKLKIVRTLGSNNILSNDYCKLDNVTHYDIFTEPKQDYACSFLYSLKNQSSDHGFLTVEKCAFKGH